MRKFVKLSFIYLCIGLALGVFYREFSKAFGVVNTYTPLGLGHPHMLVLGCLVVLIIGLVATRLNKEEDKLFKISLIGYQVGVCFTSLMLVIRGIFDVLNKGNGFVISSGLNGALSGISGLAHIILGVFIILIFVSLLRKNKEN